MGSGLAYCPRRSPARHRDVFSSSSRAKNGGFPVLKLPLVAKYTLGGEFCRTSGILCNAPQYDLLREVWMPTQDHKLNKLNKVASRHQIDLAGFKRVGH